MKSVKYISIDDIICMTKKRASQTFGTPFIQVTAESYFINTIFSTAEKSPASMR
jgi:hypothetical protein